MCEKVTKNSDRYKSQKADEEEEQTNDVCAGPETDVHVRVY